MYKWSTYKEAAKNPIISPAAENTLPHLQEPPGILPGPEGKLWIPIKVQKIKKIDVKSQRKWSKKDHPTNYPLYNNWNMSSQLTLQ